jgi:hypothetical protein
VDRRGPPFPLNQPDLTGSGAAAAADDVERESCSVVYCDADQQVGLGFAAALRIMGLDANFLSAAGALDSDCTNTEDT